MVLTFLAIPAGLADAEWVQIYPTEYGALALALVPHGRVGIAN